MKLTYDHMTYYEKELWTAAYVSSYDLLELVGRQY